MKKKRPIVLENLITGINAVLPLIIFVFFLGWAMKLVFKLIEPLTILLEPDISEQTIFIKILSLILALSAVSIIGALIRNPKNRRKFARLENRLFKILPGYTMVKEVLLQFLGTKRVPFSTVAIVSPYNNNTKQIGFVTDEHADGNFTVFVPTGPNPTSGNIFYLKKEQVKIVDVPYEQAMKAIIACGIDSAGVLSENIKK